MLARTDASPTRQMSIRRKPAHIHADLRHDSLNHALVHPRDRIQGDHHRCEGAELLLDVRTQPVDGLSQVIQMRQGCAEQKRMMPKSSSQGLLQRRQLGPQTLAGQFGQRLR